MQESTVRGPNRKFVASVEEEASTVSFREADRIPKDASAMLSWSESESSSCHRPATSAID
jgi:hypothetical protein